MAGAQEMAVFIVILIVDLCYSFPNLGIPEDQGPGLCIYLNHPLNPGHISVTVS